jgi:serine/threonine-protein kinase
MKHDRRQQIYDLLEAALECDERERGAFLDEACEGDPALRREVEKLLELYQRTAPFPGTPAVETATELLTTPTTGAIDDARFVPGDMLAGRYRIVGLLGRGGMGEVYRADDLKLKQPVALKFLPERVSADGAALARFYQEVSIARRISHRHVCRVYDIGETRGLHFLSMEYIRGEELGSLLKRIGRVPQDKAVEIARQLCAGLAAIHENGVLHRDLKPANVMLDERGDIRITDFGIAAHAEELRGREAFVGTPAYMSPEQLGGREVTVRSDVYSLGLVLYELFTGKRAFEASTLQELVRMRQSDTMPTSPASLVQNLDPLVERVILRCLESDPAKRPSSALQVAAALPGGDPLEAAIAAGETPSPEMVAAAATEGTVRPAVGAALLAVALGSLALVLLLCGRVLVTRAVPLDKPPEVLAERAREVLRAAGHGAVPADTAFGLEMNTAYYRYVVENDASPTRWDGLRSGRPALVHFWFRQSPHPLEPYATIVVSPSDPPPYVHSGMASVRLDTLGRLLALEVVPPQIDETSDPGAAPDWKGLFAAAGLDESSFTAAEPHWTPPFYADARNAWEGTLPELPDVPVRVEAASYRGQPVYFEIVGPWNEPYRMRPYETAPGLKRLLVFSAAIFLGVVAAGVWLARRNIRLGRGDRSGAFKVAIAGFALSAVGDSIGASHVSTFQGEVWLLFLIVASGLFSGTILWLLYIALEPYVRRRAPHRLVSWTRLLAGSVRDPLVGRDLLVGVILGVWMTLFQWLGELAGRALGVPPDLAPVQLQTLLGVRGIAPVFVGMQPAVSIFHGLGFAFLLLLLSLVLRGERRAAAGVWLLFVSAFALQGLHPFALAFYALLAAAYVFVASRFGVLAIAAGQFAFFTVEFYPYTTDFGVWYAGVTVFALAVVAGLAVYGFYTSLAGRPLVRAGLLDD